MGFVKESHRLQIYHAFFEESAHIREIWLVLSINSQKAPT